MTPIYATLHDTDRFINSVNPQYICHHVDSIGMVLRPHSLNNSVWIPWNEVMGPRLHTPIQLFHCDRVIQMPDVWTELTLDRGVRTYSVKIERTAEENIKVYFYDDLYCLVQSVLMFEFSPYLELIGTLLTFDSSIGPYEMASVRDRLFMMAKAYLPATLGFIAVFNNRQRFQVTLGEPQKIEPRGTTSDFRTQHLGNVREVMNRRDNPSGISRSPHRRSATTKKLKDGRIVPVRGTIVHRDAYDGLDGPKNVKF